MEERPAKARLCLKLGQKKLSFQQKPQAASNSREDGSTERPVTPPPTNSSNGSSAAKDDRETPPLSGLCNLGNTCYVNSLLQPLRFCPQFPRWISDLHYRCRQLTEQSLKENESTAVVEQADKEACQAPGITATNCVTSIREDKVVNGSGPATKENSSPPTGLATHLHTVNRVDL